MGSKSSSIICTNETKPSVINGDLKLGYHSGPINPADALDNSCDGLVDVENNFNGQKNSNPINVHGKILCKFICCVVHI